MRSFVFGLLALSSLAACGKSTCEKYADMEWKCGNYPAEEEAITKQMAEAMCEGAGQVEEPQAKSFADHFKGEAECAKKHPNDCAAYKACTDAVPY